MIKKIVSLLLITALGVTSMVGCSSSSSKGSEDGDTANIEAESLTGDLMLYASADDTFLNEVTAMFKEKYPEVNIEYFRSGTEEVISKVLTEQEAGQIQCDLLMLADAPTFEMLKEKDLLQVYESPELENVHEDFVDKDRVYYGTAIASTGIVYNTDLVKEVPKSMSIFTDAASKDNAIMPSPLYSGTAAYNLGVFTRTEGLGWEFYEAIKANGIEVTNGNGGVINSVAVGEKAYGMVLDSSAFPAMKDGSPLGFVYPEEGVVSISDPIAITKASDNVEAAQAFVDFMLSEEVQEFAVETAAKTPVRKGVEGPENALKLEDRKLLSSDAKEVAATREEDKAKFDNLFK